MRILTGPRFALLRKSLLTVLRRGNRTLRGWSELGPLATHLLVSAGSLNQTDARS